MNVGLTFDLWQMATRFANANGVLQHADGVTHWDWTKEARALGHDCCSVPDGVVLLMVRVEPIRSWMFSLAPAGVKLTDSNNSCGLLRIFGLQRPGGPGVEVFRVYWDEADSEPTRDAGLRVLKFDRGLWEVALRERARDLAR